MKIWPDFLASVKGSSWLAALSEAYLSPKEREDESQSGPLGRSFTLD